MPAIVPSVLEAPVKGLHLAPGGLDQQLAAGDTLLVFLRHFG
jgi:hypothetical protein